MVKDAVAYPVVVAVKNDGGQLIGYVVRWRKVTATPETQRQFMDLIGSNAKMYFGNNQGDLWSDLLNVSPKPPLDVRSATEVSQYVREGRTSVLALARPITGTPWFVLVEFPVEAFTAQANKFLFRTVIISVVLLALTWAGALVLSRKIIQPLHSLTSAASAIAAGDSGRLVNIKSRDEFR